MKELQKNGEMYFGARETIFTYIFFILANKRINCEM